VRYITQDEKVCETHFQSTHVRESNGKFTAKLPFKPLINQIGESREAAVRRWKSVERRLDQQPKIYKQYGEFMSECLSLNNMEPISLKDMTKQANTVYFLPYHFVLKRKAENFKFRVVFDGSAKFSSGFL